MKKKEEEKNLTSRTPRENEVRDRELENTSDEWWIWETDAQGICTYSSPQVETILGYKPDEVIGKTPFDFMSPPEAKRVTAIIQDLVKVKKPITALENTSRRVPSSRSPLIAL